MTEKLKKKAIFLDRDGVLNRAMVRNGKPYPPASLDELEMTEDAPAALAALQEMGYVLIGATNQPDVARGTTSQALVESINKYLMERLPLQEIRVCYHDDVDGCHCRKPLPGLMLDAAREYDIDLSSSFMIGDRWKDIDAGKNAGCRTIWINRGYAEKEATADLTTTSLLGAVNWIKEISQC